MTSHKMRLVTATFRIQTSLETLLMCSTDEKAEEYLKEIEDLAVHYSKEEMKLVNKDG